MREKGVNMNINFNWPMLFACVLTGYFVWQKMEGQIGWDWWWVFSPLWITVGAGAALFCLFAAIIKRMMR